MAKHQKDEKPKQPLAAPKISKIKPYDKKKAIKAKVTQKAKDLKKQASAKTAKVSTKPPVEANGKKDKKKYTWKVVSLLWNTLKGLRDYLIKKYQRLGHKKGGTMDEEEPTKKTLEQKAQKFSDRLAAIKSVSLKDLKLLVPFLLHFQLQEDLTRYWPVLESEEHGVKKSDYNGLLHQMEARLQKRGEDIDVAGLLCEDEPISKNINQHCLFIYETIEKNKPKVYSDTIDQICKIINKNKEKAEKKELSRQRNKEKKGVDKTPLVRKDTLEIAEQKMIAKVDKSKPRRLDTLELERKKRKEKAAEKEAAFEEEGEFDIDDFVNNNDILKKIHDLRMRVVKRKLKARALATQKRKTAATK